MHNLIVALDGIWVILPFLFRHSVVLNGLYWNVLIFLFFKSTQYTGPGPTIFDHEIICTAILPLHLI